MPNGPRQSYAEATARVVQEASAAVETLEPPPNPRTPEQKAETLRQLGAACYLYAAAAQVVGPGFDVPVWKAYLDTYLQAAGDPADPVERILLEQLALAHHALGRLHVRAGSRESVEEVQAYLGAIARLLAEVRRTALALKAYRQPGTDRSADATPPAGPKEPAEGRQPGEENPPPRDELVGRGVNPEHNPFTPFPVPSSLHAQPWLPHVAPRSPGGSRGLPARAPGAQHCRPGSV
jgi:hypothetical protein